MPILQLIKDEANKLDVSITLSMAFAYGSNDFTVLDDMVDELIELAQSRGGDQAAIRASGGTVFRWKLRDKFDSFLKCVCVLWHNRFKKLLWNPIVSIFLVCDE